MRWSTVQPIRHLQLTLEQLCGLRMGTMLRLHLNEEEPPRCLFQTLSSVGHHVFYTLNEQGRLRIHDYRTFCLKPYPDGTWHPHNWVVSCNWILVRKVPPHELSLPWQKYGF